MQRHVLYALLAVAAVVLVVGGISVAIQPGVQEDWRRLLLLTGAVVMATVAVLGGLNNVTELVRKLWGRTIDDARRTPSGGSRVEQVITARESRLERVNQLSVSAESQRIEAEGSTLRDIVQNAGGTLGCGVREILELEMVVDGQRPEPDVEAPMTKEFESLWRQLMEMEESLRLIDGRKAAYVLEVDVPLMLVKEEQRLRERIEETKGKIRRLERGEPSDIGAPSNGKPTAPMGAAT